MQRSEPLSSNRRIIQPAFTLPTKHYTITEVSADYYIAYFREPG